MILSLFILCITAVCANAQEEVKKPTSFAWNKAALTEIGCDADQIKKIAVIKKEATEKTAKMMENTALAEKEQKAEKKKIVKERNDAMMAILTDEQKKKVEEINAKLKAEALAAKSGS